MCDLSEVPEWNLRVDSLLQRSRLWEEADASNEYYWDHCDQMVRLLFQIVAICNDENLPNSIKMAKNAKY